MRDTRLSPQKHLSRTRCRGDRWVVEGEPATIAWFGIRLGPTTFGIFDAFPDEAGREAHLSGKVAAALMARAPELLAQPPVIEKVDLLAAKLPQRQLGSASLVIFALLRGLPRFLDSSRMGKAVEHLVASSCILSSRARLNVSTALVDDEGVDLVFHEQGRSNTLAVQVMARMIDSKLAQKGGFHAFVRG